MATLTVTRGVIDMRDPFALAFLSGAEPVGTPSATEFRVRDQLLGVSWVFSGQNLTNYIDGVPASGTVTGLTFSSSGSLWPLGSYSLTGVSLSMQQLLQFLVTLDVNGLHAAVFGGADVIVGGAGDDVLDGFAGNDTIESGAGYDGVYGGSGDDTISDTSGGSFMYGGAGADVLTGGVDSDFLYGDEDDDILTGGGGSDRLDGGAGDDDLFGGAGNDELTSLDGAETIDGGAGSDLLVLSRTSHGLASALLASDFATAHGATLADGSVIRNVERVDITLGYGNDIVDLTGFTFASSRFDGGAGHDLLVADWRVIPQPLALTLVNFEQYSIYFGAEADLFTGGEGDDYLDGGDNADRLSGLAGADELRGGAGDDFLNGGAGDDDLFGGDGADELTSLDGVETIDGGADFDFLRLSRASLGAGTALLATDLSAAQGATLADGSVIRNVERVDVTLGFGNDIVDLTGFTFASSRFDGGAGHDLLVADWRVSPRPLSLTLANFEQYSIYFGSEVDVFTGGEAADFLDGGAGGDFLEGGAGDDIVQGGIGNDYLGGGLGNDLVDGGEGDDSISLGAGIQVLDGGAGVDHFGISGSGVLDLRGVQVGAEFTLSGSVLRNFERVVYAGGAGDDTLIVGNMLGSFYAGAGVDTLIVDLSGENRQIELDDVYGRLLVGTVEQYQPDTRDYLSFENVERLDITSGSANDHLNGLAGADVLRGGAGNDGLRGNGGADLLDGGDGNDYIDGGAGLDRLFGGAGNDFLIADAGDEVDGGAGYDTFILDLSASTVAVSLALSQLGGDTWTEFADGTRVRAVEGVSLQAGSGDDTLIVDAPLIGGNQFYGYAGYDRLTIDLGSNPTVAISWQYDRFIFGSYDNFLLVQVDEMRLFGSEAGDVLQGLNAADQVFGRGGADTLSGRGLLDGGAGDDVIHAEGSAYGGDGNDMLYGGYAANVLEGGAGDDVISGRGQYGSNSGPDVDWLIGGAGDDRLHGVGGVNVLVGGEGRDVATFFGAYDDLWIDMEAGVVVIPDTIGDTWTVLYDSIEGVEGALGYDTIFGDAGDNLLIGGHGDDALIGRGGNDELRGGWDNDWIVGGEGDDILEGGGRVNVLDGGDGVDLASYRYSWDAVWVDLAAGVYSSSLDWDVFISIEGVIGSANNDNLFGSAAGDMLLGAAGDDSLVGLDGDDTLDGGAGQDWIVGGAGNDILVGGAGVDVLTGGAGADVFDLGVAAGWDVAFDFNVAEDRFALGGLSWLGFLEFDADGDGTLDTLLGYDGGNFVALGVSGLTLDEWNALVIS